MANNTTSSCHVCVGVFVCFVTTQQEREKVPLFPLSSTDGPNIMTYSTFTGSETATGFS